MTNLNTRSHETHGFDAIVIGSGITGGWAAKELTEKGLRTLVLERGRMLRHPEDYVTAGLHPWENRFPRGRLPKAELDARYRVQNRTGYVITEATAHLFVRDDEHPYSETQPYTWVRGYQVGGRSLTWGRQSYRHSVIDFEGNAREGVGVDWPIRYRDLAPWYDYVERFIGVSGQSEGLASLPDGVFQPPMDMNCVEVAFKAGVEGRYPERRVTIGRVANLTAPTDEQIALGRGKCQNRNLCMRGCPFGAYFSSNSATLVAAERTGNLTLRPNSIATSVIYDAKKGRATGVQVIDAVTREVLTFQAEVIFVCASSMNSAWILMNSTSARFPEGLGNDSDQLGRNLMDQHSRVGAAADAPGYEDKYYSGRRPNGLYIPRFRNLGDKATARTDYLRGFGFQGGAARLGWERSLPGEGFSVSRTADAVAGIGAARKAALSQPGPWTMRLSGYGEILPHPDNRVRLNRDIQDGYGLPTLTFDARLRENELAMRRDMQVAAAEMLEAAGFRNIQTYDNPYAPGMGIHEMGAARMGRDPKTSVLNGHNQVHGCRNVYVTDGAAMTSASSVNPSLTYMALTARAVAHAVQARRKGEL